MLKTFNFSESPLRRRIFSIGILSLVIFLIFCLQAIPSFVENFYSALIYPLIRNVLQLLFSWIPFSVGDCIYLLIILWLGLTITFLNINLFRKRFKYSLHILLGAIIRIQVIIIFFYLFWAINYFRESPSQRLNLPQIQYSQSELLEVSELLIDSAISNRNQVGSSSLVGIWDEAELSMKNLEINKSTSHKVKQSLLSPLISYLGTAGYFNPLTGEAQVNSDMPWFTQPFTACHELAHQNGSGPEDEANFIGFLAGISSKDPLFRYSAYYHASKEFMYEVWRTDSVGYKKLREKLSPAIRSDMKTERNYWDKYQGKVNQITSIFYDSYLKANLQPGGLKTYNEMIKLSMSYYIRSGHGVNKKKPVRILRYEKLRSESFLSSE